MEEMVYFRRILLIIHEAFVRFRRVWYRWMQHFMPRVKVVIKIASLPHSRELDSKTVRKMQKHIYSDYYGRCRRIKSSSGSKFAQRIMELENIHYKFDTLPEMLKTEKGEKSFRLHDIYFLEIS